MIRLQLLGPLSLTGPDGPDVKAVLAQPKRLALLAYLACQAPRGLARRDVLAAMFWPELDQHAARKALRQSLWVLRSHLGAAALVARGDDDVGLATD